MVPVTAVDHHSPLPTGFTLLSAMLDWTTPDQALHDRIQTAAVELVELFRRQHAVGASTVQARLQRMREIDNAVDNAVPAVGFAVPVHTETVAMVIARLAAQVAELDRTHTGLGLVGVWCQIDELVRGLDALLDDLLAGRRRVPTAIWWPTPPAAVSGGWSTSGIGRSPKTWWRWRRSPSAGSGGRCVGVGWGW